MVMGAKGVLGKRPLPVAAAEVADEVAEVERPPPRMVRRMWLKLLLALEEPAEDEEAAVPAAVAGSDCAAEEGERKRLGSMVEMGSIRT